MSEPVRVAVAVEGPTDAIVLEAILSATIPGGEFVLQTLQPERSAAFRAASFGRTGAGWTGVYRWSRQAVTEGGGSASGSSVLSNHDVLIVQVDADVAGETYASGNIRDAPHDDLPCEEHPVLHRTTPLTRCETSFSIGLENVNVRSGLSCVLPPRASRPGWSPPSGRTMFSSGGAIGNATVILKVSSVPCPGRDGSGSARTTTEASRPRSRRHGRKCRQG